MFARMQLSLSNVEVDGHVPILMVDRLVGVWPARFIYI